MGERSILIRRCYGSPDRMRPFRAYFTRSGFQVVDCPPLTTSGKNSADIVMTLDIADTIEHRTRFDEFVILSSDADFTPVALRLRAYDRITSILANQQTAAAFRSCCDVVLNMGDFEPVVDDGSERAASAGAPVQEARDRARASTHADVGFDAIRADIKTARPRSTRSWPPRPSRWSSTRSPCASNSVGRWCASRTGWARAGSRTSFARSWTETCGCR